MYIQGMDLEDFCGGVGSGTYLGVLIERAVRASLEFDFVKGEGIKHAIDVIEVACSGHAGKGCNCGDDLVHFVFLVESK